MGTFCRKKEGGRVVKDNHSRYERKRNFFYHIFVKEKNKMNGKEWSKDIEKGIQEALNAIKRGMLKAYEKEKKK